MGSKNAPAKSTSAIHMKRIIVLFLAAILCLTVAACGKYPEGEQTPPEIHTEAAEPEESKAANPENTDMAETPEASAQQSVELVGPWHLDSEKNDLKAFADSLDLFPGYGEWGASMEIKSNGQMSWYIGAEGWYGTYTVEGEVLHAQLTSNLEQTEQLWDFRITIESETAVLEMDYNDMTIYWVYGDQEDSANGNDE